MTAAAARARRLVREVASWASVLGVVPRPPARREGLAAIVRARDEEEWLEPSVRSIVGVADHVVIGDNGSTDATPAIIARLRGEFPDVVEALAMPEADIGTLTNALVERTRHRFIIRWDADFVAQTSGPARIGLFREWLMRLDRRRHFMVYPRMVEVTGDLWHQDPARRTRGDAHCWTASPAVRYVYDPHGYESPRVPRWYALRRWDTPCFYHVDVKSDRRMFANYAWKRYLADRRRGRCASAGDCLAHVLREEFAGAAVAAAAAELGRRSVARLVPLDTTTLPPHPELLAPHLARPRYRLRRRDGRIVGRDVLTAPAPEVHAP